jgi:hypothetical protein
MSKGRRVGWIGAAFAAAGLGAGAAHAVIVKGRGELQARGSGFAVLELRGGATASGIGLAVVEEAKIVERTGQGTVTPLGDGRVLLEGFGSIAVRSPDDRTRIELAGARLRLRARGAGVAFLRGVGHYTTEDGAEGYWGRDLAVELAPAE